MATTRDHAARYRQAWNAGHNKRPLPGSLAGDADRDPLIDRAHDAGREGTSFDSWLADNVPARRGAPARARGVGHRVRSRARTTVRSAARAVGIGTQLWRLAWIMLGLVALYLVLTSVKAFSGALGIVQKGVTWLVSPTATI